MAFFFAARQALRRKPKKFRSVCFTGSAAMPVKSPAILVICLSSALAAGNSLPSA
jgi:hypothetical protein